MPKIITIPVERDRRLVGYNTFKLPTSAIDSPLGYQAEQTIYWYNEARQLREVLLIFYDKARTISLDPKFAFTADDLKRAKEILP